MVAKIELPTKKVVERWLNGESCAALARSFDVSSSTIMRNLHDKLGKDTVATISLQKQPKGNIRQATELEKAWAAGFFDGEGSINIEPPRTNRGYALSVSCSQKRRDAPLQKMAEIWGGNIQYENARDIFYWRATTKQAAAFLSDILPYLLVKHAEAMIAIEFQQLRYNGHRLTPDVLQRDSKYKERLQSLR